MASGIEFLAIKGLIALFKAGKAKILLAKLYGVSQTYGYSAALYSALQVGTLAGGVLLTAEMVDHSRGFFNAISNKDVETAGYHFIELAKKSNHGLTGAQEILESITENAPLEYDAEKLTKTLIKKVSKSVRNNM